MTILETGIGTPTGPEFNPFDPQFLADGGISMIPQLKLARVVGGALIGALVLGTLNTALLWAQDTGDDNGPMPGMNMGPTPMPGMSMGPTPAPDAARPVDRSITIATTDELRFAPDAMTVSAGETVAFEILTPAPSPMSLSSAMRPNSRHANGKWPAARSVPTRTR
jgi:hypothetical protein